MFTLTDGFTVNAPVGCNLHLDLAENDLDILTLNSNSNPPSLVLNSSTNKAYADYDPESTDFSIEAKLKN